MIYNMYGCVLRFSRNNHRINSNSLRNPGRRHVQQGDGFKLHEATIRLPLPLLVLSLRSGESGGANPSIRSGGRFKRLIIAQRLWNLLLSISVALASPHP